MLRPVEAAIYWAGGVDEKREQDWLGYTVGMLLFHVGGFAILYALMRFQDLLPFNPAGQSAVAPDLSFNTAVSFITNTNWQNYGGEGTMSYLTQMLGLTHQNYLSAATGIVLAMALIRGFARASAKTVGNFWVDITRCTLYIRITICVPVALFLVWQGMPQTLGPYVDATTLEGAKQTIALGPVASQIVIKMLGTNGGGFFNANAAHPFENPTALSNFVQIILIFAIGASLTNTFGRMVGNQRQGWAILAAMGVIFIAGAESQRCRRNSQARLGGAGGHPGQQGHRQLDYGAPSLMGSRPMSNWHICVSSGSPPLPCMEEPRKRKEPCRKCRQRHDAHPCGKELGFAQRTAEEIRTVRKRGEGGDPSPPRPHLSEWDEHAAHENQGEPHEVRKHHDFRRRVCGARSQKNAQGGKRD